MTYIQIGSDTKTDAKTPISHHKCSMPLEKSPHRTVGSANEHTKKNWRAVSNHRLESKPGFVQL